MKHLKLYEEYKTELSRDDLFSRLYELVFNEYGVYEDEEDIKDRIDSVIDYGFNDMKFDYDQLAMLLDGESSTLNMANIISYHAYKEEKEKFLKDNPNPELEELLNGVESNGEFDSIAEFGGLSVGIYNSDYIEYEFDIETREDFLEMFLTLIEATVEWNPNEDI